jgi:hypothetical protein
LTPGAFDGGAYSRRLISGGNCRRTDLLYLYIYKNNSSLAFYRTKEQKIHPSLSFLTVS